MRAVPRWSRRSVLGSAGAAAGIGVAGWVAIGLGGGADPTRKSEASFLEQLRRTVSDLEISCNAAEVLLSGESVGDRMRDVPAIVASVRMRVDEYGGSSRGQLGAVHDPDRSELIGRLAQAIKDDFARDDLCLVDGWQLSMTECHLAVLKLLWERARGDSSALTCRREPLRTEAPPPKLTKIVPARTFVGLPFAVQPNGMSVINVHGAGFRSKAKILFDGVPLESSVGNSVWMNAYLPAEYYAQKRIVDIEVRNPDGKTSNAIPFEVVPARD